MKAITISQPYASLIASGDKWIENRTWPTNYRGPIAIHAGKGSQYLSKAALAELPTGAVLAIADLTACVELIQIRARELSIRRHTRIPGTEKFWTEANRHEHAQGPWCWILENVRKIEPEPATGKQGLWEWQQPEVQTVLF